MANTSSPAPRIIQVTVEDFAPYEFEGPLPALLRKIQDLATKYPEGTVEIDTDVFKPYDPDKYTRIYVRVYRPETPEEVAAREAKAQADATAQYERDRAAYMRLAAKFGKVPD